jgi:adenylate cyclase
VTGKIKKILLVDDEPEFVDMIRMRLEANGYEVIVAHNGAEGLKKAAEENPNLILLDVMMPGMDGFRVLATLRQTVGTEYVPVVMLTARGESKSLFKAQDLGVVDYLIKPCDAKALMEVVKRHA